MTIEWALLDIEASSLHEGGFPIEIAWIDDGGVEATYLIGPEPTWREWSYASECVHRIGYDTVVADGEPAAKVAREIFSDLSQAKAIFTDNPEFDGRWLSMLLATAGLGPDALPLQDLVALEAKLMVPILHRFPRVFRAENARIRRLAHEHADRTSPRTHRALADVKRHAVMIRETERLVAERLAEV
jgi:hypothetical protein